LNPAHGCHDKLRMIGDQCEHNDFHHSESVMNPEALKTQRLMILGQERPRGACLTAPCSSTLSCSLWGRVRFQMLRPPHCLGT
jgi:hypothetical protein